MCRVFVFPRLFMSGLPLGHGTFCDSDPATAKSKWATKVKRASNGTAKGATLKFKRDQWGWKGTSTYSRGAVPAVNMPPSASVANCGVLTA
jgi:hypothetical protein